MNGLRKRLRALDETLLTLIYLKWTKERPTHHFSLFYRKENKKGYDVFF